MWLQHWYGAITRLGLDVHMGRIRAAIEADAKNPRRILTVRGVGYVFAKQQD